MFYIYLAAGALFVTVHTFSERWPNVSRLAKENTRICIADCFELIEEIYPKRCVIDYKAIGLKSCNGPFQQNMTSGNEKKVIACSLDESVSRPFNAAPAIQLNLCTHILIGPWFKYDSDFDEIQLMSEKIGLYENWKALAQEKGVKAILNIGTFDGVVGMTGVQLSRVADSPSLRAALVRKILSMVDDFNFDGVNLKWHFPCCPGYDCSAGNKNDRENLVQIMKGLFEELNAKKKLVFLMVPYYISPIEKGYDFKQLVNYVDYFYVNSFMFRGAWDPVVTYDTTKKDITTLMEYLMTQFKPPLAKKLLMSHSAQIPTYFLANSTLHPKIGMKAIVNGTMNYLDWATTCLKIKSGQYSFVENEENQKMGHDTKEVTIFDSYSSLKEKIDLYKKSGLGGMHFGRTHMDDADNKCGCGHMPLLRMMAELLNGAGCVVKKCP